MSTYEEPVIAGARPEEGQGYHGQEAQERRHDRPRPAPPYGGTISRAGNFLERNGSRTCLVQTLGLAGINLGRAAGRDPLRRSFLGAIEPLPISRAAA